MPYRLLLIEKSLKHLFEIRCFILAILLMHTCESVHGFSTAFRRQHYQIRSLANVSLSDPQIQQRRNCCTKSRASRYAAVSTKYLARLSSSFSAKYCPTSTRLISWILLNVSSLPCSTVGFGSAIQSDRSIDYKHAHNRKRTHVRGLDHDSQLESRTGRAPPISKCFSNPCANPAAKAYFAS